MWSPSPLRVALVPSATAQKNGLPKHTVVRGHGVGKVIEDVRKNCHNNLSISMHTCIYAVLYLYK